MAYREELQISGRAEIVVTQHAMQRATQRCPFRGAQVKINADKAFDHGWRPEDARLREARLWLDRMLDDPSDEVRLWGGFVWLFKFSEGDYHLITIKPVDPEFLRWFPKGHR